MTAFIGVNSFKLAVLCIGLTQFSQALAQDPAEFRLVANAKNAQLSDEFHEYSSEKLDATDTVVYGLAMADSVSSGLVNLDYAVVDKSGFHEASEFCLYMNALDGLYYSTNWYTADSPDALWKIEPLSRGMKKVLERYGFDRLFGMAAFAQPEESATNEASNPCDQVNRIYVPLVVGDYRKSMNLSIYINSRGRKARAVLQNLAVQSPSKDNLPQLSTHCTKVLDSTTQLVDKICHFEIPSTMRGQTVSLFLDFKKGFSSHKYQSISIAIPTQESS